MRFRLALSKTTEGMAKLVFGDMITRGLGYRNDGPELADQKMQAYLRMFMKYPPDAVLQVGKKLRPNGWMPSVDTLETEIINILSWRMEIFDALLRAEILSDEEIFKIHTRHLEFKLLSILDRLPMWDFETERCRDMRSRGLVTLSDALTALKQHIGNSEHDCSRSITRAQEWLDIDFIPYPYGRKTDRQKELERMGFEKRKKSMVQDLMQSAEDDLINEYLGQWPYSNSGNNAE